MDDRTHSSNTGLKVAAWLALLIAILALVLAWVAYNRTGDDLEKKIQTQVQQGIDKTQNATQDAANATQDTAQDAAQSIDEGPDGVDNDDTNTTAPQSTTTP
jgi:F0F1-type ATP synthase membrane subunit b/b'